MKKLRFSVIYLLTAIALLFTLFTLTDFLAALAGDVSGERIRMMIGLFVTGWAIGEVASRLVKRYEQ